MDMHDTRREHDKLYCDSELYPTGRRIYRSNIPRMVIRGRSYYISVIFQNVARDIFPGPQFIQTLK
jgi:hypothetical protein